MNSATAEKYFIFSMTAAVCGIAIAGMGSLSMVAGFVVYGAVLLGLIYLNERDWLGGRKNGKNVRKDKAQKNQAG